MCPAAGVCVAGGDLLLFMGGERGGYSSALLAQAFPLWTTLLGLALFGEFRDASRVSYILLAAQSCCYVASAALLAASAQPRD